MLSRAALVSSLVVTAVIATAVPALADDPWGSVDCAQNPHPGCELGAGKGGREGVPRDGGGSDVPQGGNGRGGGGSSGGGVQEDNPDRANCSYRRSDYKPPPGMVQTAYGDHPGNHGSRVEAAVFRRAVTPAADEPNGDGAWYVYKCSGSGTRDAFYRPPVWIGDAPQPGGGGAPLPDPAQLAQRARDQLRLPSPGIEASPPGEQLVNLPTWLWLNRENWERVSATASVPGVSVTAVARPTKVVWRLGDGGSVTCEGPGTPYTAGGDPKRSSPDCGHIYRASSAGLSGSAYGVSATVHWAVSWSGAGESGTFPGLTTTAEAAFRVAESQALNVGDR